MLIGVVPYKNSGLEATSNNEVLVFDTDDLTCEFVSREELLDSGVAVKGIVLRGAKAYSATDLVKYFKNTKVNGMLSYCDDCWYINNLKFKIDIIDNMLHINSVKLQLIYMMKSATLEYVFKYSSNYILRLVCSAVPYGFWLTVVLNSYGEIKAYWDNYYICCTDKAYAMKIDTLWRC